MAPVPQHRKTLKRFHRPGDFHEFTFSTYRKIPLLVGDRLRGFAGPINDVGSHLGIKLVAFVFMPDHVHLLVFPTTSSPDLGLYLARIKQPFSKLVKVELMSSGSELLRELTVRERPNRFCFRLWEEGAGYDRNLYERAAILSSLQYIHMNPVRRGLCEKAIDWKWSSARHYCSDKPIIDDQDLPRIDGFPSDWSE